MAHSASPNNKPDQQIPLTHVVQFLRQFIHDVRNHLNAAELQSAYLGEITESKDVKEEIKRLRSMISDASANLKLITTSLGEPRLTKMPYATGAFLSDLREKLETAFPTEASKIRWEIKAKDAKLEIDPQATLTAVTELFENAFHHDPSGEAISVKATTEDGQVVITIREPKKSFAGSTENWGQVPLTSIRKGHYGLGLHRARTIIEAHDGQLSARYDSPAATLVTTVLFPMAE